MVSVICGTGIYKILSSAILTTNYNGVVTLSCFLECLRIRYFASIDKCPALPLLSSSLPKNSSASAILDTEILGFTVFVTSCLYFYIYPTIMTHRIIDYIVTSTNTFCPLKQCPTINYNKKALKSHT